MPTDIMAADASPSGNPFTARAALIRYWNRKVPTNRTQPAFLLTKLSPLSALDYATFSSLAASEPTALSLRLPALCAAAAHILCNSADVKTYSAAAPKDDSSAFAAYQNFNFSDYGSGDKGGSHGFKNYSDELNVPVDSFRRYCWS